MDKSAHFRDLDGMRGVLAVVVMLFHFGLDGIMAKVTGGLLTNGVWGLSVDFFFVLSGFVLAFSFRRGAPTLTTYALKRLRRLAPAFMITTAWVMLLPGFRTSVVELTANLAMVQSLVGLRSINFPAWSVPFELVVPAVAVIALPFIARRPASVLAVCLGLGIVAAVSLAQGHDWPWLRATAGIGAGFALCHLRERFTLPAHRTGLALAAFVGCIAIMAVGHRLPVLAALFPLVAAVTVVAGAEASSWLSTRPFQALGAWSYGIYLIHIPVLITVTAALGPEAVDGNLPIKSGMIVATLILSGLLHRFVERPLMVRPAVPRAEAATMA